MTEEVRERDNFLGKMNERIEMLVAVVNNDNDRIMRKTLERTKLHRHRKIMAKKILHSLLF